MALLQSTTAEDDIRMEREALLVQLQRSKTGLRTSKTRCKTFWDRVAAQEESDKLRMEAQQQVWAEHRDSHEQACLHPLSTCIAELRRWQGVQRAAHERKCIQIRSQCEHEEGNLQWAIFCARLAHDSFGALSAAPLSAEQVRVCDAAAAANLQPRTKSAKENGSSRAFTVLRAAAISVARGAASASGMVSARSTRGLACSELCQTREHLEHLLSRALSGALLVAEAGASSAASSTLSAVVPASTTGKDGKEGTPQRGRKEGRGGAADKLRPASPGAQKTVSERMSGWSAQGEDGGGGDGNKLDLSNVLPSSFLPPGKRMPLFPRSMRLSSDCLGWLHASQRSASDMHVYFVAEELEAPPLRARDGAAAKRPAGRSTRTVAERLAASAEVNAVSVAGADLRVLLPAEDRNEEPVVHLRPASVEHLLAVDCVWPKMSEADRQVLHGCYTPRDSTLTGKLTTLYIPLSDGPQTEIDVELGTVRRLRPLRPPELQELLRIYVVREPQPAAATLALPLAPANDERVAELRMSDRDDVLQHVYCILGSPAAASGPSGVQCYVLQMQQSTAGPDDAGLQAENLPPPPLVDYCQSGGFREALQSVASMPLRDASLTPPNITRAMLDSAVMSVQKAAAASSVLVAALRREMAELDFTEPPKDVPPRIRSASSKPRKSATQSL